MDPQWKKTVDKYWPQTKVELEKAAKTTKVLIDKGEVHVRNVSRKSLIELKKLSLNLNKERLYLRLGKSVATISREEWAASRKIAAVLKEIKTVERNIRDAGKTRK